MADVRPHREVESDCKPPHAGNLVETLHALVEDKDRTAFISGLRLIAEVLENNPTVPVPYVGSVIIRVDDVQELRDRISVYGGRWEKTADDASFVLRRRLASDLELYLYADRDKVCKKIVTGVKDVPEVTIPAKEAQTIPAHSEEIVEWHCPALMNKGGM